MTTTKITSEEALAKFPELLKTLCNGDVILVTEGDEVVVQLVGKRYIPHERHSPGFARGMMIIVDDSDDIIHEQFAEYMP